MNKKATTIPERFIGKAPWEEPVDNSELIEIELLLERYKKRRLPPNSKVNLEIQLKREEKREEWLYS